VILGLFFTFLALQNIQVKEFQISNAPFDEKNPKIHGNNVVVWEDYRNCTEKDHFLKS
jgi:hypothetical protein